ncbi:MAG: hypothetical protein N2448_10840 [Caloramator sp.]|nr:hypothetical protein [Caloramator sp.]
MIYTSLVLKAGVIPINFNVDVKMVVKMVMVVKNGLLVARWGYYIRIIDIV